MKLNDGYEASYMGRVPLVGIPQPRWDSEYVEDGCREVQFFRRPVGQSFAYAKRGSYTTKEMVDTNMMQPGQMGRPCEFLLTGFNIHFEHGTDAADAIEIAKKALFMFTFAGNRVYLQIPLFRTKIKDVPDTEKLWAETREKIDRVKIEQKKLLPPDWDLFTQYTFEGLEDRAIEREVEMLRFSVEGKPLRIRPTESFGAALQFSTPPKLSRAVKAYVFLEGRLFLPL